MRTNSGNYKSITASSPSTGWTSPLVDDVIITSLSINDDVIITSLSVFDYVFQWNLRLIGDEHYHCSEVVPSSEVEMYGYRGRG